MDQCSASRPETIRAPIDYVGTLEDTGFHVGECVLLTNRAYADELGVVIGPGTQPGGRRCKGCRKLWPQVRVETRSGCAASWSPPYIVRATTEEGTCATCHEPLANGRHFRVKNTVVCAASDDGSPQSVSTGYPTLAVAS